MQNVLKFAVAALVLLLTPPVVSAQQPRPELITGETVQPYRGWKIFCEDYAPACDTKPMEKTVIFLSPGAHAILEEVNRTVNARITIKKDSEHWGVDNERYVFRDENDTIYDVDRWDYAEREIGDCEDIALLKQKTLLEKGWPRSALLLTVVQTTVDKNGNSFAGGHMVLMVKTDQGDLILDTADFSLHSQPWWETKHVFRMRQSDEDPNVWVKLQSPIIAEVK